MTQAILLSRDNDEFKAGIRAISDAELEAATPGDDVVIDVEFSTINYKDGLALTNTSPVVRKWPMVAGIDAAGRIAASSHAKWKPGDAVVLNGWGIGETHWGGLAQRARAKGDWLVRIPAPLTSRDAMAIGTAGYTAALSVLALQDHGVTPARRNTGHRCNRRCRLDRSGSCSLRSAMRSSGRPASGRGRLPEGPRAREVIDRAALTAPGKPLQKERWAACHRFGWEHNARQRLCADPHRWHGRRLRPGRWHGFPRHGRAIHPARRHARGHR